MRVVWRRLAMNSGRRNDGTVNTHNTALLSVYCQIGRHTSSRAKAWSEGSYGLTEKQRQSCGGKCWLILRGQRYHVRSLTSDRNMTLSVEWGWDKHIWGGRCHERNSTVFCRDIAHPTDNARNDRVGWLRGYDEISSSSSVEWRGANALRAIARSPCGSSSVPASCVRVSA